MEREQGEEAHFEFVRELGKDLVLVKERATRVPATRSCTRVV